MQGRAANPSGAFMAALLVMTALVASGFATVRFAAIGRDGAGPRSHPHPVEAAIPVATESLLGRLTLYPACLDRYHMLADESWTNAKGDAGNESEHDRVSFYHGLALEVETTRNGRALDASAMRKQERHAQKLTAAINALQSARPGTRPGRLLNLAGDVWTLGQFAAHFHWQGTPGPVIAGRRTVLLRFRPDLSVHPHSRIEQMLSHSAGEVAVDPGTGQILAGHFISQGSVSFGLGLLAEISGFSGSFTMQPLPLLPGELDVSSTAAPICWAVRTMVVHARGRELFHHFDGTETILYRPEAR